MERRNPLHNARRSARLQAQPHQSSQSFKSRQPFKPQLSHPQVKHSVNLPSGHAQLTKHNLELLQGSTGQGKRERSEQTSSVNTPTTMGPSHSNYRVILRCNGIRMDQSGEKIPRDLWEFLDSTILKQSSTLTPKEIAAAKDIVVKIADSPEDRVYELFQSTIFPIQHSGIGQGGGTLWKTECLPRKVSFETPLTQPKPDIHFGYPIDHTSTWTAEESAVIWHPQADPITQPARGNCLPFFVLELKSESSGGTIWQAENQAAASGACCVNAMRWLLQEACSSKGHKTNRKGHKGPSAIDSIAFSASVTHRDVTFHVHHYSEEDGQHCMSWFGDFRTMYKDDIQQCHNIVNNIIKYGQGTRLKKIRAALKQLYPIPGHWVQTQPGMSQ